MIAKFKAAVFILVLLFLGSLPGGLLAQGEERLLLGFEKGELDWTYRVGDISEKIRDILVPRWTNTLQRLTQNRDPENLYFIETGQHLNQAYPQVYAEPPNHFFIQKGNATQGDYAMIRWFSSSYRVEVSGENYPPNPYNRRTLDLFNTFSGYGTPSWFPKAFPRDWRGFDLLWLDIFSPDVGLKVRVMLEDEVVEPPIERRFHVPKGKWVTMEVDLAKAVEVRGLDLTKMTNFLIMLDGTQERTGATHLLIDNIRLARKGAKSQTPIIRDDSSYKLEPRAYSMEIENEGTKGGKVWRSVTPEKEEPLKLEPDRAPVETSEPILIDLSGEEVFLKWSKNAIRGPKYPERLQVTAFDNKRLLVAFNDAWNGYLLTTLDGGQKWQGLDGFDKPTHFLRSYHMAWGLTLDRGEILLENVRGCCGYGYPADKAFFKRIIFDGKGWKETPYSFLSSDTRHCPLKMTMIRLNNGRIWVAWPNYGRLAIVGIHAKYSDDNGHTWHSWQGDGKIALIPGSDPPIDPRDADTYPKNDVLLTSYGEQAACIWHDKLGVRWSCFDGKKWSEAKVIETKVTPSHDYPNMISAVTLGDKDIHLSLAHRGPGLYHWDGRSWHHDQSKSGFLSITQDKLFLFNKSGNKIECWQKKVGGAWQGPRTIISEKKPINLLAVPLHSPPNFIPLAWTLEGGEGIRVLKVPAP